MKARLHKIDKILMIIGKNTNGISRKLKEENKLLKDNAQSMTRHDIYVLCKKLHTWRGGGKKGQQSVDAEH